MDRPSLIPLNIFIMPNTLQSNSRHLLNYLSSSSRILAHLACPQPQFRAIEQTGPHSFLLSFTNSPQSLLLKLQPPSRTLDAFQAEYSLTLKLFEAGIPVFQPLAFETSLLNLPFIITEWQESRTFEDLSQVPQPQRAPILEQTLRVVYQYQTKLNLPLPQIDVNSHISAAKSSYKLNETKIQAHVEDLIYWFRLNSPPSYDTQTLCHGNLTLRSFRFHPTEPKIISVENWDSAHLGCPLLDISNMIQPFFIHPIPGSPLPGYKGLTAILGVPQIQEVLQSVFGSQLPDLRYYIVLSLLKLAAENQQLLKHAQQLPEDQRPNTNSLVQKLEHASKSGWELLREMTHGDPYNIRLRSQDDAHRWAQWPASDRCKSYYYRVKDFIKQELLPVEWEIYNQVRYRTGPEHWHGIKTYEGLQAKAREQGLWNLFLSDPVYGVGLTNLEYTLISELIGRSYFGHELFNCFAPETGNIKLLIGYGTPQQKEKYLIPLLEGQCKSFFAMTEKNVASSDPINFETTLKPVEGGYLVNGRKWYLSGIGDIRCKFGIIMGKSNLEARPLNQQSMLIIDMPNPGIQILRTSHVIGDDDAPHGYFDVIFKDVFVPAENLLGKDGAAFAMAQRRLVGSRLAHSVRQLGLTTRCLDIMKERSEKLKIGDKKQSDDAAFLEILGKQEYKLSSCRVMLLNSAMTLDALGGQHYQTLKSVSECKAMVPKMCQKIIDEVIQAFGIEAITDDHWMPRYIKLNKAIRFMDGPCELHYKQIAKFALGFDLFNDFRESDQYGLARVANL